MTPGVVVEALGHPAWVMRYLRTGGIPMMRNWQPYAPAGAKANEVADLYGSLTPAPMVQWKTLAQIRRSWAGPLVVKGLLHPEDARRARAAGVDALIVSNHGGRQLDCAPSPLDMLSEIRTAVGDDMELILDSGVRRGSDVIIAKCLGARLCLFGRPTLFGVAAFAQPGARRALQIVRNEVDVVMAQIGADRFEAIGAEYLKSSLHRDSGGIVTAAPAPRDARHAVPDNQNEETS
jgi:L-lactate dehydrogenase (cytochrome)/(S)-mandelate dehydrogenase